MPSAKSILQGGPPATFVVFDSVSVRDASTSGWVVHRMESDTASAYRGASGFIGDRLHLSADGHTVVRRVEWTGEADYQLALARHVSRGTPADMSGAPEIRGEGTFRGWTAPGLRGPDPGAPAGVVIVATRHLRDPKSCTALIELMAGGGEWKQRFPGFVSATPHLGTDGRTFITYSAWVDDAAYKAWIADPRVTSGQEAIARLEVAPPEYQLCTIVPTVSSSRL